VLIFNFRDLASAPEVRWRARAGSLAPLVALCELS
jgi:hypothetical protein